MDIKITQESRGEIERIQREFQNKLSTNEILRGTSQGINSALSRSISRINKQVKKEYNITQKYLSRVAKVLPKANSGSLWGGIKINAAPLPMIAFKPKQSESSISVSFHKGKAVHIRKAFIATMSSGHTGVFSRGKYIKGKFVDERSKTQNNKIRVTQRMGPAVFTMSINKTVANDVQQFMGTEVSARVEGILRSRVDKIVSQNK